MRFSASLSDTCAVGDEGSLRTKARRWQRTESGCSCKSYADGEKAWMLSMSLHRLGTVLTRRTDEHLLHVENDRRVLMYQTK